MIRPSNWKKWFLTVISLVGMPAHAGAGSDISSELVKAGFILQMHKFIEIGNPAHRIEKICYYERSGVPLEESVGQLIEKYAQEHTGEHLPAIKHFEAIRDLKGCDIFYIPADEEGNIDNILTALNASDTVTISAAKRFIMRGGIIGFVMDSNNRVKMEANLNNIKGKKIRIDAQLLEIMMRVIRD